MEIGLVGRIFGGTANPEAQGELPWSVPSHGTLVACLRNRVGTGILQIMNPDPFLSSFYKSRFPAATSKT